MRASLLDSTIGRIRPATLQDLPVIAALHCECFADGWDVDFLGRLWAQRGAIGAIAFEKGAPAGFLLARVNAGEAEILSLGVRLPSRRRSLGTALVKNVLERAVLGGAVEVFLEVAVENAAAQSFYSRLGFREVGLRSAYYGKGCGPRADALILRYGV